VLKYRGVLVVFLLVLNFVSSSLEAQERGELLLMNGKILEVLNFNDSTFTNFQYQFDRCQYRRLRIDIRQAKREQGNYTLGFESAKGVLVPKDIVFGSLDRDEVFSYTKENALEKIYYVYDEPLGNVATVEEMKAYVLGERDARLSVSGNFWLFAGAAVGAITGYVAEGSVLSLAVPPLLALSARIPIVKIKTSSIQDLTYKHNQSYAAGYERYSRGLFARKALIGGAIGTALGLLSYTLIDNNS